LFSSVDDYDYCLSICNQCASSEMSKGEIPIPFFGW